MTSFVREERYLIIKLKDLSEDQLSRLESRMDNNDIIAVQGALVIEQDWPEFEPAWKMIEDRMTQQPMPVVEKCSECNGTGRLCMAGCSAHPSNWYDCDKCSGSKV